MATMQTDHIALDYDLLFTMPFHFGTGLRAGLLDRTVVRDRNGVLYVPASTLKGVWREKCEQLERLYKPDNVDRVDTPHNLNKALWGLGGYVSMSTRIFGSPQYPGPIFFEDAYLTKDERDLLDKDLTKNSASDLQTSSYTQVHLERPARTSVQGALYTSEFGLRNFLFQGKIEGSLNCMPAPGFASPGPTCSLLLLLAGLHMIERLGGNKSTGKGACTFEIKKLALNNEAVETTQWQGWLEHLDALSKYDYTLQEEEA
ncbi:MAG TPA: RAMP superfamily CRISPR-associated protein [Ktedonobacteraceae bacterium]|nr:RAMP superfamily CRISPR-associated protein [Ktedonobacteraceae bacterium]